MEVRLDIASKENNVVESAISVIKYDDYGNIIKSSVVESPLSRGKDIETEDIKTRLEELIYRCLNFTSKFMGVDELTGKSYDANDLKLHILRYVSCYNMHHCAGNIIYHPQNEYMLKWIDLLFWKEYDIIPKVSLAGKKVNVMRSSGNIETNCKIDETESILWSKLNKTYIIRVSLENGERVKFVTLENIYKYNPDLELEIILPDIDFYNNSPQWVIDTYNEWLLGIDKLIFGENEVKRIYEVEY
jgi:hypothetical protein